MNKNRHILLPNVPSLKGLLVALQLRKRDELRNRVIFP